MLRQATKLILHSLLSTYSFPCEFYNNTDGISLIQKVDDLFIFFPFLSLDLVGPIGLPSFPPFSTYCFLPEFNRNEILSRSNWAQDRKWCKPDRGKDGMFTIITQ